MKRLFLLDGMALVYRAHFALIARPIYNSKGINTSALYGFTQTLLDIIAKQQPTHLAVAFDTDAPTKRHADFADYKANRQAMPEDLSQALPSVRRLLEAFRIPVLTCDGYEADDLIGTLARKSSKLGFQCYMVTPDKDFGQLVSENIRIYKPGRMGSDVEILGPAEVCARWGISRPEQVIDILALMGDSSDNIPGVPGIGEKTASKLVSQYGSVEALLDQLESVPGKLKENLRQNADLARLSKKLATLDCDTPCDVDIDLLAIKGRDDDKVKQLFVEFEFTSIGRRLFGEGFSISKTGGQGASAGNTDQTKPKSGQVRKGATAELELDFSGPAAAPPASPETAEEPAVAFQELPTSYTISATKEDREELNRAILRVPFAGIGLIATDGNPRQARLLGMAICTTPGTATYVPFGDQADSVLKEFAPFFNSSTTGKAGHDLKRDLALLKWHGSDLEGPLFDSLIAHGLLDPEGRHSLDRLCEGFVGRAPASLGELCGLEAGTRVDLETAPVEKLARWACGRVDFALRLKEPLERKLKDRAQERVFYDIECPLMKVLVGMEHAGIRVDAAALQDFASKLGKELDELEKGICKLAGTTFNLNSPRQLGTILFDVMRICEAPKKTKTGQYATDEQTLLALAPDHEVVQKLLEHRAASKLKSTYADALPLAIWPATGRIHTTYQQVATSTGRLNSQDPNLQNIPIRSDRGQEIRKAFIPADADHLLLSADYSQIELRIIAALSKEAGLIEAFEMGLDVHLATAAKVYGVALDAVTSEMRRKAKMVNYGIAYGISSFGLAQRLNIPRREGAEIIDQYFRQFPRIREFMDGIIESARTKGYVETVTGRRRYIRDINSRNQNIRGSAERNAINAPIQGTAADMIKIAMVRIALELQQKRMRSRMLLQVHDELVFDLFASEEEQLRALVQDKMTHAIELGVPVLVDIGVGKNWLEAH